jgi:hypothetical protein
MVVVKYGRNAKIFFFKKKKKLTPGSALTGRVGGWFEAFEATLDLLPRKKRNV